MNLSKQNILIISPESWGQNFVSKHHYAKELARQGCKIFFLNPPRERFKIETIEENLLVIDYKPNYRGLGKLPKWLSAYLTKREINQIEKDTGVSFDVIWNFDSSRFFNLASLKYKTRICHLVDMSEGFQRPLLAGTSDICFCTSDYIAKELKPFNNCVHKIHHGYAKPIEKPHEGDISDIQKNEKVKVGYVGNLAIQYLDWPLIYQLVNQCQMVDFYFIGSTESSNLSANFEPNTCREKTKSLPNTYFLGQKHASLISQYLVEFDIHLVCYQADKYLAQLSNPHKFMEYLGSGKVTISTYTDEYKDKRELLEMVDERKQFIPKFEEVTQNLAKFNSKEKQAIRKEFALNNTYTIQIERIEQCITASTGKPPS